MVKFLMNDQIDRLNIEPTQHQLQLNTKYINTYDIPAKNKTTEIDFFDKNNNNYKIIIGGNVDQNEIDFIISSIKLKE